MIRRKFVCAAEGQALDAEGVERPGPGQAPTAFRIWRAGENPTSKGVHLFTQRSAELLVADQAARGVLYSIDVDHMSVSGDHAPEHRRAVGWHRLAVRGAADGPELWAVGVDWSPAIKAGLEAEPPEWRYFSPAYDVDAETGEIVGYLNTALTNQPATWQVTALASRAIQDEEINMTLADILAALKAMAEGGDENAAKAARMMKAAEGEEPKEEPKPEPEKAAEHGEPDGDEEPKKASEGEAEKATIASLAATVQQLSSELAGMKKAEVDKERKTLLASLAPELASVLAKAPIQIVRDAVAKLPKAKPAGSTEHVQATRGEGQVDRGASRLSPAEKAELDARMGIGRSGPAIRREGDSIVFSPMTPAEARQVLASKGDAK